MSINAFELCIIYWDFLELFQYKFFYLIIIVQCMLPLSNLLAKYDAVYCI